MCRARMSFLACTIIIFTSLLVWLGSTRSNVARHLLGICLNWQVALENPRLQMDGSEGLDIMSP